jgi:hypothetical protein
MGHWSLETRSYALELRKQGETYVKIAEILGKGSKAVETYLLRVQRLTGFIVTPPRNPTKYRNVFWNKERKDNLLVLLESGKSRSEAGTALGVSRNAVTSVVDRMRLAGVTVKCNPAGSRVGGHMKSTAPRLPRHTEHPPMTPVGLLDRTGCAFPTNNGGPYLFCNNHIHGQSPYCEFHGNLMFKSYAQPSRTGVESAT